MNVKKGYILFITTTTYNIEELELTLCFFEVRVGLLV